MKLIINGELFETTGAETIIGLVEELEIDSARVAAVEVNFTIVRRADFSKFRLKEGDQVEIVNFVGGG